MKRIIYIDMDDTLCAYKAGYMRHRSLYPDEPHPQSIPGLYVGLDPMPDAISAYEWLSSHPEFIVFILTAPSIMNPHSYSEKRLWVEIHLGMPAVNNLIISPHKGLNKGHYLIDDNIEGKGQEYFEGQLLHFGSKEFPDWNSIRNYFERQL